MTNKVFKQIYAVVARIPRGEVVTYGEIAKKLKISPRVVGFALSQNPRPIFIPCHRVVGKNGHLTGYIDVLSKKRELLEREGVKFKDKMHVVLNFNN